MASLDLPLDKNLAHSPMDATNTQQGGVILGESLKTFKNAHVCMDGHNADLCIYYMGDHHRWKFLNFRVFPSTTA